VAGVGGFLGTLMLGQAAWGFGPGLMVASIAGSVGSARLAGRISGARRLDPVGCKPRDVPPGPGVRATVRGAHELVSPAGSHECLAYCLELRLLEGRRETVMYRDAVTSGFEAVLGTGETARIPPGRVHLVGDGPEILDVDNLELDAFLRGVDPHKEALDPFDPLHFHVVREEVLFAGDQVDLMSELTPVLEGSREVSYRDRPRTYLAPVGVPALRRPV
jgi:hypothetical protein